MESVVSRNQGHRSIQVVIDFAKSSRCDWCGTMESTRWERSPKGTFCSAECRHAYLQADAVKMIYLTLCVGGPIAVVTIATVSVTDPYKYGQISLVMILFLAMLLLSGYSSLVQGKRHEERVPKGSRSQYLLTEHTYIKSLRKPAKCPNCDGNIDLSKTGPDLVYHCEYCGASGKIHVIRQNI